MTETPKKLVHWQFDTPSLSNLNSPFFNTTNDSLIDSTSSLEFINGQLVAHGYVPSPGLSLDGISSEGYARVVKCLLALLSQRVEDMSRTEELTTKVRTLTYDHERMVSMHRKATEQSANAEREMNLHKSRLSATLKTLQTSESSHKQTSAELQRTRTLLQGVRTTHQAELKKKEKEIERMLDKWQKISDAQSKVFSAPSGMRCLNAAVVDGTDVLGKGQGFLEIALEQAEQARSNLSDDNLLLRKLIVRSVNELQSILHHAKSLLSGNENTEEPTPLTLTTLFPASPPNAASEKLDSIFNELRRNVTAVSQITTVPLKTSTSPIPAAEVERLQGIIAALKEEIALCKKQSITQVADTQAMFDKFAEDHRISTGEIGEMSIELMSAPLEDEAKERLEVLRKELDDERQKFTDAAIRFGKEKAALETERLKFAEEKRSQQVELMLAELPPTPVPSSPNKAAAGALSFSPKKSPHKSPHKSPRRAPTKNVPFGKAGSGRKSHRVSRRSPASPVAVTYETEVIPPIPALSFPSMKSLAPPTTSLFPNSFVLPPPSPHASLPTKPALPLAPPDSPPESTTPESEQSQSPTSPPDPSSGSNLRVPSTPPAVRHPFPVAKPFALRMIHAYSPAKPSPLSRILMLADSPATQTLNLSDLSPTSGPLEAVSEEMEEGELGYGDNGRFPRQEPQMSLAAELGVESPPESPLQERKVEPNVVPPAQPLYPRGRVFFPDPNAKKAFTTAEKGKAKVELNAPPRAPRTSALGEKENNNVKSRDKGLAGGKSGKVSSVPTTGTTTARKTSPTGGAVTKTSIKSVVKASTTSSTMMSRTKSSTKPSGPPVAGTGPRRVLINSADAPPIGKGWKG